MLDDEGGVWVHLSWINMCRKVMFASPNRENQKLDENFAS